AARAQRIVRHPLDETAQLGAQRRHIELALDVLEPVVEARTRHPVRPHGAERLARSERHAHDVARGDVEAGRHPVRVRLVERDRYEDVDDGLRHESSGVAAVNERRTKGRDKGVSVKADAPKWPRPSTRTSRTNGNSRSRPPTWPRNSPVGSFTSAPSAACRRSRSKPT